MAIELCKAAIWIETVEPGKPLTFIDSKIRCGDALVGVSNFSLIGDGIPDSAYAPQERDDAAAANHYWRLNRAQRDDRAPQQGQRRFPFMGPPADLVTAAKKIETMPERTSTRSTRNTGALLIFARVAVGFFGKGHAICGRRRSSRRKQECHRAKVSTTSR